jgi:hypothetical protein
MLPFRIRCQFTGDSVKHLILLQTLAAVCLSNLSKIPARDPKANARLMDLTRKYNALLTVQWHPDVQGLPVG